MCAREHLREDTGFCQSQGRVRDSGLRMMSCVFGIDQVVSAGTPEGPMRSQVQGKEAERTEGMRSQERTDDSGSYVLMVTKGDRDMGQLKLTLKGFQRWGPIGCTAVDSQVSSLEMLQVDPQKPWSTRPPGPEDPGFWIPCTFGSLVAPLTICRGDSM